MGTRKAQRKTNILSVRISDREMESVRQIMERTSQNASEVMRDAFRALYEGGGPSLRESRR
ncbi:ribbon-helix-helix protein, CopG family [Geoalkalibacter sp.]|uniref:ribbon-helix-helix protein, CopG family n=1 Tax=Geoalkalibacter sp. TaxID=3041440 RepID=UPI00272E4C7A|nr:ribbon-helix-helix protein, CopG family [Geoalkalibacter sp.]